MPSLAITGAAGAIGSLLRTRLREDPGTDLVLLDRVPLTPEAANETVHTVDLTDGPGVAAALKNVDAVVHMGGIADEAPLADLLAANVLGTHNVLEAARLHGIRRVVLASSNRVGGFHPNSHVTTPEEPPRPDGLYGVSKVAAEALGRMYSDKFGVSVVCLRIGSFEERPSTVRELSTWLSPDDCVGFVRAAVAADTHFSTVYAVSGNKRRFWALPPAAFYSPSDDAESLGDGIDGELEPLAPQAGHFASAEYTERHL
ncbi:NAD(P)-dependent oxidoreductase [Phytomonospora sp. NPDC050363]|uniref:NAD-dependent epimerase/dehydratase family protein n=1 Tax=Phytomonospora sp. NPDC050363 TaxID=3155642 RepID=UPI0033C8DFE8